MRNTFSEFLRLSQQLPRPHAATYFGSLLTQKGVRNPFGSLTPLSVLFNANIMSLSFYFVNSFLLFFFVLKISTFFSTKIQYRYFAQNRCVFFVEFVSFLFPIISSFFCDSILIRPPGSCRPSEIL